MNTGDEVEVKEYDGGSWRWATNSPPRRGHITNVDKYCYSVRTDDGKSIRDMHDHFRAIT